MQKRQRLSGKTGVFVDKMQSSERSDPRGLGNTVSNEYTFLNDGAGAAFALVAFDWKGTPESCYGKSFRSNATQGVWGIRSPMNARF